MKNQISIGGIIYALLWITIAAVSSVDIYWSVRLHEDLSELELNPLGQLIMEADNEKIALFMGLKTFGTFLVLAFLIIFYRIRRKMAWAATIGVFLFQVWLLFFLTLYESGNSLSNAEKELQRQYNNNDTKLIIED